ncbi:LOW QUALITY PROTEIN: U11/U12 small nuclear ribonucleoprotein 25 kDa protein-like [Ctenocephalides felis]|uniref:LOW QUALITY PROTEIN: U11/U12 small nuclear ribonucleoprotein 25 kDa protein-like n=1 Tax=Ctenocephalides felis TaxID=7515 RepID=UPI000E6E1BC0|nr:LOW QUALITY PROTEIN: U11/U12 small nuclear ribonucleoprotein 25 kDa protein-like [Ctenocephalides felis]
MSVNVLDLNHQELCELTNSTLSRILSTDPLMSDLPGDIHLEEIQAQIAAVKGQYLTVQVVRTEQETLKIMIPERGSTVLDLKKAIKRHFELQQIRNKDKTKISWKYIWRTYYLQLENRVLENDNVVLKDFGLRNNSKSSLLNGDE